MCRAILLVLLWLALAASPKELAGQAGHASLEVTVTIIRHFALKSLVDVRIVLQALDEAKRRLRTVRICHEMLRLRQPSAGPALLDQTPILLAPLGGTVPRPTIIGIEYEFMTALAIPNVWAIVLNADFLGDDPRLLAAFLAAVREQFRMPRLDLVSWTAASLIHELHHLLGLPNDAGKPEVSLQNQARVLEACFSDIREVPATESRAVPITR